MLIHDCAKLFGTQMRRLSEKAGVPSGYRVLLMHLSHDYRQENRGIPQYELASVTHLTAPTISVTLQKMEQDGLVERRNDKEDARQIRVYLTQKGFELDSRNHEAALETEEKALSGLTEEELTVLERILLHIKQNLSDEKENFVCSDTLFQKGKQENEEMV
jgi:DNA-binding MarR family transcriptional regulator